MDVQEIRNARNKGVVAFTKFCQDRRRNDDCIFCFFEGEDNKYYGPRIESYTNFSYDKILAYNCGGRAEVLKAHKLINDKSEYDDLNMAFFIDRDYAPLKDKPRNVYQTPCYSVENFYTSVDCFSQIIVREFGINVCEDDFIKCVEDYKKRQTEFHEATLYLNAWLSVQRKVEEKLQGKKINLASFKISKLFSDISIEKISVKLPIEKDVVQKQFPQFYDVSEEEISNAVINFKANQTEQIFRGKFEILFLRRILDSLKDKNNKNLYFSNKRDCVYIDPNVNTLSTLSRYADTPKCLIEFLEKHKRIPA